MSRIFLAAICLSVSACAGWQIADAIMIIPDMINAGRALAADGAPQNKLVCDVPPGTERVDPTVYCHSETAAP